MRKSAVTALVLLLSACGGGGGSSGGGVLPSSPPSSPSPTPRPTLTDDWTTYAHDVQRTGFEQANTGITPSTVSSLQLAWRVTPNPSCQTAAATAQAVVDEASPVVAGGYVYYADTCGYVAALNRVDGSTAWSQRFPVADSVGGTYGTPTLDTANNVLIVSMWGTAGGCGGTPGCPTTAHGAYLAALNAKTGQILWQTKPPAAGNMRGEPLVLNGVVYQGISGGDTDSGAVNGGMMAVNESTGALLSTFYVAPASSPWDGGGSWSPISYDGQYIYFGTGNTRNGDGYQDSVIQLDPTNMQPVQNFGTYGNDPDEDVGGGEMIWQNTLYFSGKSGNYYAFPLSSPWKAPLFSVLINGSSTPQGNGGISTPTTDGSVIAVSSGYNATTPGAPSPNIQSDLDLFPVGSSSMSCKLRATNSSIFSYAAFVNGVGFIGLDNQVATNTNGAAPWFVAFNDQCKIIWTADPAKVIGFFYGGPAVVQSGVYAVDNAGNVYSWKLPQTIGVMSAARRAALVRPAKRVYLTSTRYARTHRATL